MQIGENNMNFIKFILTLFIMALLAYTINSFAAIKASVTNDQGKSFGSTFETQELAEAWIASVDANDYGNHLCAFGYKDRWLSFEGEPTQGYTNTRQVLVSEAEEERTVMQPQYDEEGNQTGEIQVTIPAIVAVYKTEYFYPKTYLVTYVDISAQIEEENEKALLEANKIKGAKVVTHLQYLNNKRNATNEVKLAFGELSSVKSAESWLNRGRLDIAKTIIQNAEVDGTLITTELKAAIIAYIDSL